MSTSHNLCSPAHDVDDDDDAPDAHDAHDAHDDHDDLSERHLQGRRKTTLSSTNTTILLFTSSSAPGTNKSCLFSGPFQNFNTKRDAWFGTGGTATFSCLFHLISFQTTRDNKSV